MLQNFASLGPEMELFEQVYEYQCSVHIHTACASIFRIRKTLKLLQGFWRNWHASFNRWLVRYAYVPLGGASWRAGNVWLIFGFVALWHDLEPRLLGWAALTCLLFAPELVRVCGRNSGSTVQDTKTNTLHPR